MAQSNENRSQEDSATDACGAGRKVQTGLDAVLAEMKRLAKQVAAAWTSPKSGVELVDEQRR